MRFILIVSSFFSFGFCQLNAQNTCATALPIVAGNHTITAINGSEVPNQICAPNGFIPLENKPACEWYIFVPSVSESVKVTTDLPINVGKDTRFHVFDGSCNSLNCIAGDDDSGANYLSEVTFYAVQGTTYYIVFDNRWSTLGFDFKVIEGGLLPVNFDSKTISISPQSNCVVDMNGDYLDDIVHVSNNKVSVLKQQTSGVFTIDEINLASTVFTPDWSIAAGDYDRNGFNDLVLGNGNRISVLKSIDFGNGFAITEFPQNIFSQRTNFIDINNDGNLDVFACHDAAQSHAYRNDGAGNLVFDISLMPTVATGGNYASVWTDYNNDGAIDMYLSKCKGGEPLGSVQRINLLYKNNGNGTFTELGSIAGVNDDAQTWSTIAEDFDNDGFVDLFVSNISDQNRLYHNNGNGTFTDIYSTTGINPQVGSWEIQAADFNNDGFIDFLWQNGNQIYLNNGNLTFSGFVLPFTEGGIGDLNNDGFLDVQSGDKIYFNIPNANNWIKINLQGLQSNRNGIGARVEIYGSWGLQIREIKSGNGFSNMSSLSAYFGIGKATNITKIVVHWPSGIVDEIENPSINNSVLIIESTSSLSTNLPSAKSLTFTPNPVKDILYVDNQYNLKILSLEIVNLLGQVVFKIQNPNNQISLSELKAGNYIVKIKTNKGNQLKKIIKI